MERLILSRLFDWKTSPYRKPLNPLYEKLKMYYVIGGMPESV